MLNLRKGSININIELDNGVYLLPDIGGIGKTRLFELCKSLSVIQDDICCVTYSELEDRMIGYHEGAYSLFVFDRLDAYISREVVDLIISLKDCIVLCSLKDSYKFDRVDWKQAGLHMSDAFSIEVGDYAITFRRR